MLDVSCGNRLEDRAEIEAARGSIKHRQSIEQEATGQSTQHKILHGRFSGVAVVSTQSHQCITAERQQFQT